MDLTREEIIHVLQGMRVELPTDTKLPLDALDSRLTRALDRAQTWHKFKVVDPSKLRRWNDVSKLKLLHVMGSLSAGETDKLDNQPSGASSMMSVLLNPFTYLRSLGGWLGASWDGGSKNIFIDDKMGNRIYMHLEEAFALTDDTPIIIVQYETGLVPPNYTAPLPTEVPVHRIPTSTCTQKLLLKILEMNAKRLSTSYIPPSSTRVNGRAVGKKDSLKIRNSSTGTLSFLLPILPLSMREVGGLSNDFGCAVCGQPSVSRCAACQYVAYCSKACQKADWTSSHKSECSKRALASGTWIDVDMSSPGYPGDYYTRPINEFSPATQAGVSVKKKEEQVVKSAADWPPPNIHGKTPFVIKVTVPEPEVGFKPLMIYDRRRSIEFFLGIEADLVSYEALLRTTRESGHPRIFLFAKRTASTTLSVCLDREPPPEYVKW